MQLLLIEDDTAIAKSLIAGLQLQHFEVYHAATAASAGLAVNAFNFDIIILDLTLPDGDGITLLRNWRAANMLTPVLILSARDQTADKVRGLRQGADDYLLKPFDFDELVARLHSLLRRSIGKASAMLQYGALQFDPSAMQVYLNNQPVSLTQREVRLLAKFIYSPRQILTTAQLEVAMSGQDSELESNALNVHIYHLRRKLGADVIDTIRGLGYRLGSAFSTANMAKHA